MLFTCHFQEYSLLKRGDILNTKNKKRYFKLVNCAWLGGWIGGWEGGRVGGWESGRVGGWVGGWVGGRVGGRVGV